jgi:DNA-binding CsgD family transcriptional regulator
MSIEEFIEASNRAASVEELFEVYKKAMAGLGFDRLIFSLMTDHLAIERRAGHGIIVNYPADWMEFYLSNGFEAADPVRHKMYVAEGAFAWSSLLDQPHLTRLQERCLALGAESGLRDGIGIPLRGPRGAIAGIGAASSAGGVPLDRNTLSRAQLLSAQFYTAFLALERKPQAPSFVPLTDREQEVLKWCSRGKTKAEISDIMCLSENTIKFHMKIIFQKLETHDVTLAVLKAYNMGLIQL